MSPLLSVVWVVTLLTLVMCATALSSEGEVVTALRTQLRELEARLSTVEDNRVKGMTDKVYGDFIREDNWVLVFRATSGIGSPVYDTWTRAGYHDDYQYTRATMPCGCTSTKGSCDRHYRSRLLESWPSSALDKVKLAVYEGGVEKTYMVFTGLGSNYINWFSADRLVESSWKDLKSSAHNYFSILGTTDLRFSIRRFYISNTHHECPGDRGWLAIRDSFSTCSWEVSDQVPAFVYSKSDTAVTWDSAGDLRGFADVMAVWVKFGRPVDLTQACMP